MHTNTHKHIQKAYTNICPQRDLLQKKDKPMQISSILGVN